jgi:YVTN family beta-propeller protein
VSVIDGKTNKVIVIIPVGKEPEYVSVNPSTNAGYDSDDNTVSVIDGKTNVVTATTIQTGSDPIG